MKQDAGTAMLDMVASIVAGNVNRLAAEHRGADTLPDASGVDLIEVEILSGSKRLADAVLRNLPGTSSERYRGFQRLLEHILVTLKARRRGEDVTDDLFVQMAELFRWRYLIDPENAPPGWVRP